MDTLRRILIVLVGISLGIGVHILVMIYGWGLTPKSFWWIIGMAVLGQISAQLFISLGLTKK